MAGGWHEPPVPQQKSWHVKQALTSSSGAPKASSFLLGGQPQPESTFPAAPSSISVTAGQMEMDRDSLGWLLCQQPLLSKMKAQHSEIQASVWPFCLLSIQFLKGLIARIWISCCLAGRSVDSTRNSLAMLFHFVDGSVSSPTS